MGLIYNKLSCRTGTAQCYMSVEIMSPATYNCTKNFNLKMLATGE